MALIVSAASGNFNAGATWVGGVVPGVGDEAQASTGHTVTITANATCNEISNSGTGKFVINNGVTLTANVTHKSTTNTTNCLEFSANAPASTSIVGNLEAGGGTARHAVVNLGTGTLNITGNCTAGNASGTPIYGVNNASSGTVNITGNCYGITSGSAFGAGANNNSTGTVNITGNCFGGIASNNSPGALNSSTGILSIIGTIYASNTSNGVSASNRLATNILSGPFVTELVNGTSPIYCAAWRWNASPSPSTYFEVATNTLNIKRTLYTADNITGMPAASNVKTGVTYGPVSELTGTFDFVQSPSAADIQAAVWSATTRTTTGGTVDTLTNAPASVTPTDIWSHATRTLTSASGPSAADIRSEMDSNSTKLANLDATISSRLSSASYTAPANSDIAAIKSKTDNLPSDPADQSLVESAISALSIPSAASVASAVRTELTEISNLDASVSSRLASASYTAPANSDITAIKAKTDNIPASPAAVSDIPTTAQISAAVEGSLLDENDGQAVLNALVGAIGNQNVDEIALVAAIRSDLERSGGKLDSIPTDAAPSAASVATAVWSASTKEITGGTVDTLTNSPDVPTEAEIATQVRTELSVELGRIDAAISSRLAPSGTLATVTTLTNAPTVPTAAAIADEVRVELATELARIDAPVSGATAPSAATVATAVRSELATELARVDQAVSSRLASSAYTAPANSDVAAIKVKTDALVVERLNNCATTAIVGNLLAQANS